MSVVSRYVPVDLSGKRVVIVGASIAGLATALSLGERGAEVLLVDADPAPDGDTPDEAFFEWQRRRVPQIRHSHAFLARLRNILVAAYPDFYTDLVAAGAVELRLLDFPPQTLAAFSPEPDDDKLTTIGCRRTTFEWMLRRYVEAKPSVEILSSATVSGLVARRGEPPEVEGVRVDDGSGRPRTIAADIVVDASGRGSKATDWLAAIGAARPFEERSPSGLLYYTRFYRRHPGVEYPMPGREPNLADFGWIKFAIFPADASCFSITFGTHISDQRLKVLQHVAAFEEMTRTIPGVAPFAAPEIAEPTPVGGRDVLAMGGLENCMRRFVDEKRRPLARGFFAIGDAAYHTNPLYGRGSAQAFMHASLLGEALDVAVGDLSRAAALLDQSAREEIEPFYHASVAADGVASRRVGAEPSAVSQRFWDSFFQDGVFPATRVDPLVFRAFVRMMNMVETPERAFLRPDVLERVVAVWLRGSRFRKTIAPTVPDRDATIAACERAAGIGGAEPVAARA